METILIIDDEKSLLDLLSVVFKKEGYAVRTAQSAAGAYEVLAKDEVDLVVTDIKMPGADGMDVLRYARENLPDLPVILITAYGSIAQAVEALKAGALDYVVKPFDVEELKIIVGRGLAARRLKQENLLLKRDLKERYGFEQMIGKSRPMQEIYILIEKVASTDSTVLITGESGTGKEMAARAVHQQGARRDHPFVSINCAALPENLLESELFGHVRGSFTGAVSDKKGMFELAQRGTLFLDEVGEMSPWTQVKLLRALQERKVRRVGGADEIPVDVRIIAATNQDLKKRIAEGKFREELFYRLNVISVDMPPLRKRVEDIPILMAHFLQKYCEKMGKKPKRFTPDVVGLLEGYSWPGNIRELENVIERIVAIEDRETVTAACLPQEIVSPQKKKLETQELFAPGFSLTRHLDEITKKYIQEALAVTGGSLQKAAPLLGLSYRTIRYLIGKYDLNQVRKAEKRNGNGDRNPA
ncbi:MAG: sigma-54-dependent Fis family transcriptional regulator [Candidatus Aminicenantes bacterium]|nr:sigma-54-dependent Fis family transcriptional regulator [Candidatus Aminicenantes bacterium]NLH77823.1 sigma-54-dependent Fis family transcriptional regulator [Acidobacteriota bacterium]